MNILGIEIIVGTFKQNLRSFIASLIALWFTLGIMWVTGIYRIWHSWLWFYLPVSFILYYIIQKKSYEIVKDN